MRQPITMWPLKQQVSQGCVRVCKVCACGACGWWGEGWGDARCQVSGLIMALPAQSGRLVGWELYKPQKGGQEATKLHTRANPAFAHTHTPQVACSRHGSEAKERVWTRGLSCDTQSDNKSKAATQAGGGEAPAQCQCRGGEAVVGTVSQAISIHQHTLHLRFYSIQRGSLLRPYFCQTRGLKYNKLTAKIIIRKLANY